MMSRMPVFLWVLFYSAISSDLTAGWGNDIRLTFYENYDDYGSSNGMRTIAVADSVVHCVWQHENIDSSVYQIYYKRSTDNGENWQPDRMLRNTDAHYPSIGVCGDTVHVVWEVSQVLDEKEIYYRRSIDGGITWGGEIRLSNAFGYSGYASIAVHENNIHVVWQDERDGGGLEVYYKRSTDAGTTWEDDQRLTYVSGLSRCPSVAVWGDTVHVAFTDNPEGFLDFNIYYIGSTDNGTNWGAVQKLTNDPDIQWIPCIAVYDNTVLIAWEDARYSESEIHYVRSTNGGTGWETDKRLTYAAGGSTVPSLAMSENGLHIVWADERDGNFELYHNISTDGGANWNSDERITNASGSSYWPAVVLMGGDVHVVFTDERDGNEEIYYKKYTSVGVEENGSFCIPFSAFSGFTDKGIVLFFSLPSESIVRLSVFDVSGRMIDSIERLCNKGRQKMVWRNSSAPRGVYFFLIEALNRKAVVKAILISN